MQVAEIAEAPRPVTVARLVSVRNLSTLQEVGYVNSHSVEENVRNAYFQMERKDMNTWDYDRKDHPPIETGRETVSCGDWCAFKDGHPFQRH